MSLLKQLTNKTKSAQRTAKDYTSYTKELNTARAKYDEIIEADSDKSIIKKYKDLLEEAQNVQDEAKKNRETYVEQLRDFVYQNNDSERIAGTDQLEEAQKFLAQYESKKEEKRDSKNVPSIKLHNGQMHPMLGYGTYKVGVIPASASGQDGQKSGNSNAATEIVLNALKVGYRFLDCAQFYANEKEVGLALKQSGLKRSEVFLVSKIWNDTIFNGEKAIRAQLNKTLNDLGVEYVDIYIVHWPVPGKHVTAYQVLEKLQKEGKIVSLGISNYTIEDYEELKEKTTVKPVINQIEVNPFLYRKKTIDYFQKEGIMIQAYRALRQGKEMKNPKLIELSKKYNKTPAQILGIWCIQKKIIYLPKSSKMSRMVENSQVFDCNLDMKDISDLDKLTTETALQTFQKLYFKCVVRDTELMKSKEGVKENITIH